MLLRVAIGTDGQEMTRRLERLIQSPDIMVESPNSCRHHWEELCRTPADVFVVTEDVIPEPTLDRIEFLRGLPGNPAVVVLSDSEQPDDHASFLAANCDAALYEGLPDERLREALKAVFQKQSDALRRRRLDRPDQGTPQLSDFACSSEAMKAFMRTVQPVVRRDTSLLITGETGVGKEHLARAIHGESPRSERPFVAVNCGALPESLLESELFGAFTGASSYRRGVFEMAHGGTLFLDEIGEMTQPLQVRLLRVLEDRSFRPLGSEKNVKVDVRIMAASNKDLEAEVDARNFRKDLFYRLSVMHLHIPPLRDRREDIPELVESYLVYLPSRIGCDVSDITDEAMKALCKYEWPGNVRELINVLERAMLLCEGDEISLEELPQSMRQTVEPTASGTMERSMEKEVCRLSGRPWKEVREQVLERVERAYLEDLLRQTGGRVGETARRAGMRPRSLYEKMKRHGLCKEDFK